MKISTGLMWYDRSARPLDEKLREAASAYEQKHGHKPNVCYVNPAMLPAGRAQRFGMSVEVSPIVRPGHIVLGVASS
jgi:hypothetical protein